MKIVVYCSEKVNEPILHHKNKDDYFEIKFVEKVLTADTVDACKGYDGILINTLCIITEEIAASLKANGVKYIASRAAGTDHLDRAILNRYGLKAANVPSYSPNAISELTILMVLNLLRKMPAVKRGVDKLDFTTDTLCGRELKSMKVGVLGHGNIGMETLRILKGFACDVAIFKDIIVKDGDKMTCIDMPTNEAALTFATYKPLDVILAESDILIFHIPLTDTNYHLVDASFIAQCKDGVMLINTARGGLFDFEAVLNALESGKVSSLGFDVYEDEERFVCQQSDVATFNDNVIEKLCAKDNVIFTPHIGYYTKEAIVAMLEISLDNLMAFHETNTCKNQIGGLN